MVPNFQDILGCITNSYVVFTSTSVYTQGLANSSFSVCVYFTSVSLRECKQIYYPGADQFTTAVLKELIELHGERTYSIG